MVSDARSSNSSNQTPTGRRLNPANGGEAIASPEPPRRGREGNLAAPLKACRCVSAAGGLTEARICPAMGESPGAANFAGHSGALAQHSMTGLDMPVTFTQ